MDTTIHVTQISTTTTEQTDGATTLLQRSISVLATHGEVIETTTLGDGTDTIDGTVGTDLTVGEMDGEIATHSVATLMCTTTITITAHGLHMDHTILTVLQIMEAVV